MKKRLLLFVLGLSVGCFTCANTVQGATTITFENDTIGFHGGDFVSADSSVVTFKDSLGIGFFVNDFGIESDGKGLSVFSSGQSYLTMEFSGSMNWLELEFGNDDPSLSSPGDEAVLTIYVDDTQVGQSSVVMNRDDVMNQTISISGIDFNRATFIYNVSDPSGLVEVVDNVSFDNLVIPAPGAIFLAGVGTALCGMMRRRYL